MTQQLRHVMSRLPLGVLGFVAGSVLAGIVIAAPPPDPSSGVPLPVREQNLDANGWIRVHEQGTTNVSGTVEVDGDIAISNFPETQNVNITNGSLALTMAPVTAGFSEGHCFDAGTTTNFPLPFTINATNIEVTTGGDTEMGIYFRSPLAIAGFGILGAPAVFSFEDFNGEETGVHHAFTRPVPINSFTISCVNESDQCCPTVDILGDSAAP